MQRQTSQTYQNTGSAKRQVTLRDSETLFPGKLHDMMSYVEAHGLESAISWVLNGTAIMINNPEKLLEVLPIFFSQSKYRSFRRQLNMWHFIKIKDAPYKGAFMHPFFVKGMKPWCTFMSRHIDPMEQMSPEPISHSVSNSLSLLKQDSKNYSYKQQSSFGMKKHGTEVSCSKSQFFLRTSNCSDRKNIRRIEPQRNNPTIQVEEHEFMVDALLVNQINSAWLPALNENDDGFHQNNIVGAVLEQGEDPVLQDITPIPLEAEPESPETVRRMLEAFGQSDIFSWKN